MKKVMSYSQIIKRLTSRRYYTKRSKRHFLFVSNANISNFRYFKLDNIENGISSNENPTNDKIDLVELADNPFFIAQYKKLEANLLSWKSLFPDIVPYYSVSSNDNLKFLTKLSQLNIGFGCESQIEIQKLLCLGVRPNDIIYSNPCKEMSHISYARKQGVDLLLFDNVLELQKIRKFHPNCKILLRINHGDFYSDFTAECKELIDTALRLKLDLIGVSLHVGKSENLGEGYIEAIQKADIAFKLASSKGLNLYILDLGNNFPPNDSIKHFPIDQIKRTIDYHFKYMINSPLFRLIARPGGFFSSSVFSLVVRVIGKNRNNPNEVVYYINDGIYGNFRKLILNERYEHPKIISYAEDDSYEYFDNEEFKLKAIEKEKFNSSICGPSNNIRDCILRNVMLPDIKINDWLVFDNMGSYSTTFSCNYYGFSSNNVIEVSCQTDFERFMRKMCLV